MRETESSHEFITMVQTIINHLKTQGETIKQKNVVEKILTYLPPKFDPVVINIEWSKDTSSFKI